MKSARLGRGTVHLSLVSAVGALLLLACGLAGGAAAEV